MSRAETSAIDCYPALSFASVLLSLSFTITDDYEMKMILERPLWQEVQTFQSVDSCSEQYIS